MSVTRLYPQVTVEEVVAAFRMAFPDIKKIVVLENKDTGDKATERATERSERITQEAEKIVEENPEVVEVESLAPKLSWEK